MIKRRQVGSTVFSVSTLVLNVEDGGPSSIHLTYLVLVAISS